MGRLLADREQVPDLVISSTAVRARTTAELAAETGDWDAEIILDRRLYGAGPGNVLEVVSGAPDMKRLMLVGHQPTWSGVVAAVTGARADMKTASVASIEILIDSWSEVLDASGILEYLLHPKMFFGSEYDVGA
jgi:phosphohistidine phosphatase